MRGTVLSQRPETAGRGTDAVLLVGERERRERAERIAPEILEKRADVTDRRAGVWRGNQMMHVRKRSESAFGEASFPELGHRALDDGKRFASQVERDVSLGEVETDESRFFRHSQCKE